MPPNLGFLLGAFTKLVATVATYPLQVAQTRLRASRGGSSFLEAFLDVYEKSREGNGGTGTLSAYFKGMGPKMVQTVLNSAIMFYFYERLLLFARRVSRGL